ncbi:ABC transporter permease [Paenibacillus fonticola]|uniref:ABC transporter permease n=1 Tax=Paenibacillus fonticola TaxID=379896 RepID=UPI00036F2FBF|nr:ABC transporter permease [Paenibacillus fonticola]
MKATLLLCFSQLRKKKVQNISIAILIFLSTLLITTSITVLNNTGNVFQKIHTQVNGSQELLNFENGLYNPDVVHDWWEQQNGVETSQVFRYHSFSTFTHNAQEVSNISLYLTNAGNSPGQSKVDQLIFATGEEAASPKKGEIWIPTSLAYSKGITVGDQFGIKTDEKVFNYRVSALVIDVPYSQPFTVTARIWMNSEDYKTNMAGQGASEKAIMGLRFDNLETSQSYWQQFEQDFGAPFLETITDYNGISAFYLIIGKIVSSIMIFLAAVMIMIALYTIAFIISDAVLSNYKNIGVLRSLGFTGNQTVALYVMQYGIIAVLAILPSVVLSYFFSKTIISLSLSYLKTNDFVTGIDFPLYGLIGGGIVLTLILLVSYLSARGARKIKPAQAIRYGRSEENQAKSTSHKHTKPNQPSLLDKLSPVFVISLKRLRENKGSSLLLLCMTIITTSVLIGGVLFMTSIASMNPPEWGYDNADISLEILNKDKLSKEQLIADLKEDPRVASIHNMSGVYGVIPGESASDSETPQTGIYITSAGGNMDALGFENIAGRNPQNAGEISIGAKVSQITHKGVGDSIEVFIQGKKKAYTVVGVYQAITNMSVSARVNSGTLEGINVNTEASGSLYLINITPGTSDEQFAQEMGKKYGDAVYVAAQKTLVRETFSQAQNILLLPMLIMGLFLILAIFGIASSVGRINVKKESRTLAIYKSLGMTSSKLRASLVISTLIIAWIGAIIGLVLGTAGFPTMLNKILVNFGIVNFPMFFDWTLIVSTLPLCLLVIVTGIWSSSRLLKNKSITYLHEN